MIVTHAPAMVMSLIPENGMITDLEDRTLEW